MSFKDVANDKQQQHNTITTTTIVEKLILSSKNKWQWTNFRWRSIDKIVIRAKTH